MRPYAELKEAAGKFGLNPANGSVEDTIAQRDLLLGCIQAVVGAEQFGELATAVTEADLAAATVEAIVDGLLEPQDAPV